MKLKIAIVEDDILFAKQLQSIAEQKSHLSSHFLNSEDFVSHEAFHEKWDLIIYDLCYPTDTSGQSSVLRIPKILHQHPEATLVVCSSLSEVSIMKTCIEHGAQQFVWKDYFLEEFSSFLDWHANLGFEKKKMESVLIGQSYAMKAFRESLLQAKLKTSSDVLIEGESGSGKELVAQLMKNSHSPLIAINVSAIAPELFESEFFGAEKGAFTGANATKTGYLEATQNGILFLDEVQNFPLAQQSKLLRVLENRSYQRVGSSATRRFEGRLVFASNRNLKECVDRGTFREDLYYRMSTLTLRLPPLRNRRQDIPLLAKHFMQTLPECKGFELHEEANLYFETNEYEWPGNVRELRNVIRQACLQSKIPFLDSEMFREVLATAEKSENEKIKQNLQTLPPQNTNSLEYHIDWELGFDANLANLEKRMLTQAVTQWEPAQARAKLKISKSRYYEKLKAHGL